MRKILLLCFVLAACGAQNNNAQKEVADQESCPSSLSLPHHEVVVHSPNPFPAKLSLVVNGEYRYGECASFPDHPPYIQVQRFPNSLRFTVLHQGFYSTPPAAVSFKIMGAANCNQTAREVFAINNYPLRFVTDYPNGKECGARTRAQATFVIQ